MKARSQKGKNPNFKEQIRRLEQISPEIWPNRCASLRRIKSQLMQIKQKVQEQRFRKEIKSLNIVEVDTKSIYEPTQDDLRSTDCHEIGEEDLKLQSAIKQNGVEILRLNYAVEQYQYLGISSMIIQEKTQNDKAKELGQQMLREARKNPQLQSSLQPGRKLPKRFRLTKSELPNNYKQGFSARQLIELARFQIKKTQQTQQKLKNINLNRICISSQ